MTPPVSRSRPVASSQTAVHRSPHWTDRPLTVSLTGPTALSQSASLDRPPSHSQSHRIFVTFSQFISQNLSPSHTQSHRTGHPLTVRLTGLVSSSQPFSQNLSLSYSQSHRTCHPLTVSLTGLVSPSQSVLQDFCHLLTVSLIEPATISQSDSQEMTHGPVSLLEMRPFPGPGRVQKILFSLTNICSRD